MSIQEKKIIIIDDDPVDLECYIRYLKQKSFRHIYQFLDTNDAIDFLATADDIGCVLIDYYMPQENGLDFLKRLRKESVFTFPIIFLTGANDTHLSEKALELGAEDYQQKSDITPNILLNVIQNASHKHCLKMKLKDQQETIRAFASMAAHDLNAPLVTVKNYIKLLLEENDPEKKLGYINRCLVKTQQLSSLFERLLQYEESGIRNPQHQSLDTLKIVRTVQENLQAKIEEANATLKINALPTLYGDENLVMLVFHHIIENALKFRQEVPIITISGHSQDDQSVVTICDNGIGIKAEDIGAIFKPFTLIHTKRKYGGSGLGLAICDKIVLQMQGTISVSSSKEKGTVFTLSFPNNAVAG